MLVPTTAMRIGQQQRQQCNNKDKDRTAMQWGGWEHSGCHHHRIPLLPVAQSHEHAYNVNWSSCCLCEIIWRALEARQDHKPMGICLQVQVRVSRVHMCGPENLYLLSGHRCLEGTDLGIAKGIQGSPVQTISCRQSAKLNEDMEIISEWHGNTPGYWLELVLPRLGQPQADFQNCGFFWVRPDWLLHSH